MSESAGGSSAGTDGLEVRNVPERRRYEAVLDGEVVGYSVYDVTDDTVAFTHARVYTEYGGRGIASQMARVSLDDVRANGRHKVRPVCSFYRWYIDENPEYADLL